jgi:dTDP-4-amino-4,6-dideoxygalactose transaminase
MEPIQMVDLKRQYDLIKDEINQGMQQVLSSSSFINGPVVKEFQNDLESYLGVKHVIPCANGTDSLQIALMSLKLKPGDEVITSDFAFVSVVEVISLLNLKPVLVDVNPDTFNIDPLAIEKVITPRTKAIIPVHLFGQTADMERILVLAKKYNLFVIEDNAQAIGADYTFSDGTTAKTGTLGHVSTTSFFPSKNLGAYGDGGAIFTNDDNLAELIRGIVNHGMYNSYCHDIIGVNSRLDSLQAVVLKVKLKYLDIYNGKRKKSALSYTKFLKNHPNIITPSEGLNHNSHIFHQYTIRIIDSERDSLVSHLNSNNIPCGVYYPIPLHMQKAYKNPKVDSSVFPVTNQIVNEVISLPMHSELSYDQIEYICNSIFSFFD